MRKIILLILASIVSLNMKAQKKKAERLTVTEFKQALVKYNAKEITIPRFSSSKRKYYSGEPDILLIASEYPDAPKYNQYEIAYDREETFKEWEEAERSQRETPLKGMNDIIQNLEAHKDDLLNALFDSLKMKRPEHLLNTDLKKMDAAIKKFGYKNAFEKLMLNMNVFCGECVREKKPGKWTYIDNPQQIGELIPVFVDNDGRDYEFNIYTRFFKQYYEFKKYSIKETVEFALLPTLGVYPNPSMTNPRTQTPQE